MDLSLNSYLFGIGVGIGTMNQSNLYFKSPILNLFTGFVSAHLTIGALNLFVRLFNVGLSRLK